MSRTRVLLVDDHALFREGLAMIISAQPDRLYRSSDEAWSLRAGSIDPDGHQHARLRWLEATRQIKKSLPDTTIIMLTVQDDSERLFEAIKSGAQGYLLKNTPSRELIEMLRGALRGEAAMPPRLAGQMLEEFRRLSQLEPQPEVEDYSLTLREQEVLHCVAQGLADKEIAGQLSLSLHTVKTHMRNILTKLQVGNRREAALLARNKGLV
jgi:DNA-binding NarL/FixJ family response regulator